MPCVMTKAFIKDMLAGSPALGSVLSVMAKENHSALVEAYDLNLYPTLLIVGPNGHELDRVTGGANIRDCIEEKLTEILEANS